MKLTDKRWGIFEAFGILISAGSGNSMTYNKAQSRSITT